MHDLLADDGSIYVHCDWRVSAYLKLALDEIFSKNLLEEKLFGIEMSRLDIKHHQTTLPILTILCFTTQNLINLFLINSTVNTG